MCIGEAVGVSACFIGAMAPNTHNLPTDIPPFMLEAIYLQHFNPSFYVLFFRKQYLPLLSKIIEVCPRSPHVDHMGALLDTYPILGSLLDTYPVLGSVFKKQCCHKIHKSSNHTTQYRQRHKAWRKQTIDPVSICTGSYLTDKSWLWPRLCPFISVIVFNIH